MQETLKSFGWYLHEFTNKSCCGGPKQTWKNADYPNLKITIVLKSDMFIVRRLNRVIFNSYEKNLFDYLVNSI